MTGSSPKIEVLDGPQRRRHWTAAEKLSIVQETYEPTPPSAWSPAGMGWLPTSSSAGASSPPRER
jgi:transposase